MVARSALPLVLLMGSVIAGCIAESPDDPPEDLSGTIDHQAILDLIGVPITVEHDHSNSDEPDHRGGINLELVSWSDLGMTLGDNGFANFVIHADDDEELAFVAVDGDTRAGFAIVDISDPTNLTTVGTYMMNGNSVQEVRVFASGDYALMNVQDIPDPNDFVGGLAESEANRDCNACLHLIDVRDRAKPVWVDALPVDNIGTHNMHIATVDGMEYVFYVGQPASYNFPSNVPGNYVGVAQLVETGPTPKLVRISEWRDSNLPQSPGRSFPHDAMVYEHPLTGQAIGYISYWDAGAVTVDFSDPLRPITLDVEATIDPGSVLSIHWFQPEPEPRADGRVIAWSAPEFAASDRDTGHIRAYDVTDPAAISQIGAWTIPGGDAVWNPGAYTFSGHTTIADMDRGILAVSHYHAGVWVLDITDPTDARPLGYYMPNGGEQGHYTGSFWWKKPNFNPDGFLPNVYQARWHDDLLFVTERGTGMYVLDYTGPIPGSLTDPPVTNDQT